MQFSKMHGLGNDFVVIDAIAQTIDLSSEQIEFIADRHFGIGCDQLLLVENSEKADVDFRYRIFNADGGEVEQCGNGARCFARFVRAKGLSDKNRIRVETQRGNIVLHIDEKENISVDMGPPDFTPEALPMQVAELKCLNHGKYSLQVDQKMIAFGAVSMGNPHAVLVVDNIDTAELEALGSVLELHPAFPQHVNVGFMQIVDRQHIRLRVFERGAGETKACGTGACAAVVVAQQWGLLDDDVQVQLPGGNLQIQHRHDANVILTGDAVLVFDGEMTL
ncbi:diaminopimelate epimerase [Beggiatoa alba]|nr:diaminopimelate epimerase [Beggiatoa alba]